MSSPPNPLDIYATYTYHFELHAHTDWDVLAPLSDSDTNSKTTRWEPSGTLLINTRKDAHQVIDDVKYTCLSSGTARGGVMTPTGSISFMLIEPGGFGFMDKIKNLKDQQGCLDLTALVFVLKPIFVGRTPDNAIQTLYGPLIPFTMANINAKFDHRGGWYACEGLMWSDMAATRAAQINSEKRDTSGPYMNYAFTNKSVAFESQTVQSALSLLQTKLQENYDETYEMKLAKGAARKLTYKVNPGEMAGKLNSVLKDSFAEDADKKFAFDPKKEIGAFCYDIIARSSDLCDKIAESKPGLNKQFHPGVFIPIIVPRVCPKAGEVEITYDIKAYKGGGPRFEFDYFFAGAGKNVDILQYEVVFNNMWNWMAGRTDWGTDCNVNLSSSIQTYDTPNYIANHIHPDITREKIYNRIPKKFEINMKSGDVAYLDTQPLIEKFGFNQIFAKDVPHVRAAFDTLAAFVGAVDTQQTMTIRGNLDIFNLCASYPDGSRDMFNTTEGAWIKINIFMVDDFGAPRQFYYTGYWWLYSVVNIFSGGKFTQQLTMQYLEQ